MNRFTSRTGLLAIVSLLTVGSMAQAQTVAPGAPQARQQRNGRNEGGRGRLLRGIKLSDAEKARVKEIRGKYRTETKALQESLRPAMQDVRGRVFTAVEREIAWAASLWMAAYNAREFALNGDPSVGDTLRVQAAERLRRAGMGW